MRILSLIFLIVSLLSSTAVLSAQSVPFELKTYDGLARFGGQIDYPENCQQERYKAVILVAGTGLYYRNTYLGLSGTKRDYIFKDLSQRITKKCIAVVRYDYRGVSCDLTNDEQIERCLDQQARKDVDAQTIIDDIQAVYDYTQSQNNIDTHNIAFLAHSEGSLNVARLVKRESVHPQALIFIGGMTESPKELIRWQFIRRSVDLAFEMDTNENGILTNWEIIEGYPGSFFDDNDVPMSNLLSPTGMWNRFGLTHYYTFEYNIVVTLTLASPSIFPYRQNGIVYSGINWWKTWFNDDEPVLAKLKDFTGPITYFNGTIDLQAPGKQQLDFLRNSNIQMKSRPKFHLIKDKGHLLNSDPLYGPIDLKYTRQIIETLESSLQND